MPRSCGHAMCGLQVGQLCVRMFVLQADWGAKLRQACTVGRRPLLRDPIWFLRRIQD